MGFTNRSAEGSKYITFKEGKIKYKNSDGEEVFHSGFYGKVIDLDIKNEEFDGKPYRQITLFIEDEDEGKMYEMQMALESGYGNAFCCIAPNIDWKKPIEVSPTITKKEGQIGKGYGGMFISQPGKDDKWHPVKWKFTKDEPGKRPEVTRTEKKVKGKVVVDLDYTERNDFYEAVLVEVRKSIKKATGGLAEHKPSKPSKADPNDITEPIDDLPF